MKATRLFAFLMLSVFSGLWLYVILKPQHKDKGVVSANVLDDSESDRLLSAKATGPSLGPANSQVLVVEFTDLQCPSCKTFHAIMRRLVQDNPDVHFVFQNFPLPIHGWAFKAASYAECLKGDHENFWKFTNAAFEWQESVTSTNIDPMMGNLMRSLGLNDGATAACAGSQETKERVNQSIELGKKVGVTGTPTLFINGRKVSSPGRYSYEQLNELIRSMASTARHSNVP